MVIPINHHLSKEVLVFFLLSALFIHHPPLVSGKVLKKIYVSVIPFLDGSIENLHSCIRGSNSLALLFHWEYELNGFIFFLKQI
jgi:hypothetical protein